MISLFPDAVEDLGLLSITSKALRDVVCEYTNSRACLKRLQPRETVQTKRTGNKRVPSNSQMNSFRNIGRSVKTRAFVSFAVR